MPFAILTVCVGNVCRSPIAERLLTARLPEAAYVVSSAGVGALAGSPMEPEAVAELERRGGDATGFAARQLTPHLVAEADLVLTATTAIRSRVLEDSPGALRRAFTFLELAALLEQIGSEPGDTPSALVARAAAERSRLAQADLDVADPYRQGPEAHARAASVVDDAVTRIAAHLPT